jgi:hypothetical protein
MYYVDDVYVIEIPGIIIKPSFDFPGDTIVGSQSADSRSRLTTIVSIVSR